MMRRLLFILFFSCTFFVEGSTSLQKDIPPCFIIDQGIEEKTRKKFQQFVADEFKKLKANDYGQKLLDRIETVVSNNHFSPIKISNNTERLAEFRHGLGESDFDDEGFPTRKTELVVCLNPSIKEDGDSIVSFKDNAPEVLCRSTHVTRVMQLGDKDVVISGIGYCPFYMIMAHELIHLLHFLETLQAKSGQEQIIGDFVPYGKAIAIKSANDYFSYIMKKNKLLSGTNVSIVNKVSDISNDIYRNLAQTINEITDIDKRTKRKLLTYLNYIFYDDDELDYLALLKLSCLDNVVELFNEEKLKDPMISIKRMIESMKNEISEVNKIRHEIEEQAIRKMPELEDTTKIYSIFDIDLWKNQRELPWPDLEERRTILGYGANDISEFHIKMSAGYPIRYFYDEKWGMLCEMKSTFDKYLGSMGIDVNAHRYIDDISYVTGTTYRPTEASLRHLPIEVRVLLRDKTIVKVENANYITQVLGMSIPEQPAVPVTPSPAKNLQERPERDDMHTPQGSDVSSAASDND